MGLTALYLFLTVVFASTMQSITGFGFNIVGTPILMMFIAPKQVVSLAIFGALILNLMVIHKTRGQGSLQIVLPMFAASVAGILPGVYMLKILDSSLLKLVVGIIVILMAVALALNFSITIKRERLAAILAGGIGGFMGGATSMSGPVVVMFLMNQKQDKVAFRANLVRFFCLGNIMTLAIMYVMGVVDTAVFGLAGYIVPGVLVGTWLGDKVFERVSPTLFRHLIIVVLIVCGLLSVVSELGKRFF
jgi:uncharacterized membrane protein YfcA